MSIEKTYKRAKLPKDLIDFHLRWDEFRPCAEELAKHPELNAYEREVVAWLHRLAERIGHEEV